MSLASVETRLIFFEDLHVHLFVQEALISDTSRVLE